MSAQVIPAGIHAISIPATTVRPGQQTPPLRTMPSFTRTNASPTTEASPGFFTASPPRGLSSSPRLSSPARSYIFERDVQDSVSFAPHSPAIPSHIATENYIPSVLDASSAAITDRALDPDTVEIITHNSHQPAAVTVAAASPSISSSPWVDDLASLSSDRIPDDLSISNFGSFEARTPSPALPAGSDVRRLSFISFADVVQGEQFGASSPGPAIASRRESIHMAAGLTSLATLARSASPKRSPGSSQGVTSGSPPGSVKGVEMPRALDMSPSRRSVAILPGLEPDVAVETMAQALRRTTSGELAVRGRSYPVSPI